MTGSYRYTGSTWYRNGGGVAVDGEVIRHGDVVDDVTETELSAFGDCLEPVDGDGETCDEIKGDGDVCGRELPCPYHSDDGDD